MPIRQRILAVVLTVIFFTLGSGLKNSWAQKDAGSIAGTVRDPSGAVVPNAKVTVTDLDHGQTFQTATDTDGGYVASPLRIGRYTVTVVVSGFKKAVSEPVTLDVQQRAVVNIALQVGQISETIQVSTTGLLNETNFVIQPHRLMR